MRVSIELEVDEREYRVELTADQGVTRRTLLEAARQALTTITEGSASPIEATIERVASESTHKRPTEGTAERPEFLKTADNYSRS